MSEVKRPVPSTYEHLEMFAADAAVYMDTLEARCVKLETHWKRCVDNIRVFCAGFDHGSNTLAIADALISAYEKYTE